MFKKIYKYKLNVQVIESTRQEGKCKLGVEICRIDFVDFCYREHTEWQGIIKMERYEPGEHGKYCSIFSCLIVDYKIYLDVCPIRGFWPL
jgi:hypothetical protein